MCANSLARLVADATRSPDDLYRGNEKTAEAVLSPQTDAKRMAVLGGSDITITNLGRKAQFFSPQICNATKKTHPGSQMTCEDGCVSGMVPLRPFTRFKGANRRFMSLEILN
jgi:hypothetical protein